MPQANSASSAEAGHPTVTIITAVYNGQRYLSETLRSVTTQTFQDWEYIVVDDASTDSSFEIANAYAEHDPRFRILREERNVGALAARNLGLEAARGRYVAFLDADDLWLPEKLEKQVEFMRRTAAAISHTGYRRVAADATQAGPVILPPAELCYRDLLKNTAIAMSTGMVDTTQLGGIKVPVQGHPSLRSDLRFWLTAMRGGAVARGIPEDLARYRVVPGSVSSSWLRSSHWVWRVYRDQEALTLPDAAWCFSHYAVRAALKRLR